MCIYQLIRFARVCSQAVDFNARNKCLTATLPKQRYRWHKLRKAFSKFYHRHHELVAKFNVGLKSLLYQCLSEPEFYGDLVCKFKRIIIRAEFLIQFREVMICYKRTGYNLNVMQHSACLVINPITVDNFAALLNCILVVRTSDSMMASASGYKLLLYGTGALLSVAWSTGAQLMIFFCFRFQVVLYERPGISSCHATHCILLSPRLRFFLVLNRDLFVNRDDSLMS